MAPAQAVSATEPRRSRRRARASKQATKRFIDTSSAKRCTGSDATQLTTCTAEEIALHLVIDAAEGATRDASLATDLSLPANPDRDEDFNAIRELHFRDHDVLLLFDASLDGIEAPNSALDEHGLFANLHPQAWFLPFEDDALPRPGP